MFNKTKIQTVQARINDAIAQIAKEEKVRVEFGGIRYSGTEYGTRMTVTSLGDNGSSDSADLQTSKRYGFDKNIVGEQIRLQGKTFTISGFNSRARKYPIKGAYNGKTYKLTVEDVKRQLK